MASSSRLAHIICFFFLAYLLNLCYSSREPAHQPSVNDQQFLYHQGPLLSRTISVNLIWYGRFKPTQRAIIADFITSLSSTKPVAQPSVAKWWTTIGKYYQLAGKTPSSPSLTLGAQTLDDNYSLGKYLTSAQIAQLASKVPNADGVNVVLTADDVAVERFCRSCGTHNSVKTSSSAYIWVGNSEKQCPGQCAWPFHQPIYGPQNPPRIAPNGDVGLDGMVINLATLLAGTATNPFGNGFYKGPKEFALEAGTACTGVFGSGAYPGYPGKLLVDSGSGASYNANGANSRKYLLPAVYDPSTSRCSTLV